MSKSYTFKPQGNYVAAELIKAREKTEGGIYLPDQAQDRPHFAKVLAVGDGVTDMINGKHIPVPLKPGDIVVINKFSYQTIELPNGDKIALFNYGDCYGKLVEEEDE